MFTSLSDTIVVFIIIISITLDDFGRNMLTIHTIFTKCEIHMSGIIFVSFPSVLVLQYWLPTKVICEGALIHGTLVVTND